MLTILVLIVLFEPLVQDCDDRYLKPTILAILGIPRLAKMASFGYFAIIA